MNLTSAGAPRAAPIQDVHNPPPRASSALSGASASIAVPASGAVAISHVDVPVDGLVILSDAARSLGVAHRLSLLDLRRSSTWRLLAHQLAPVVRRALGSTHQLQFPSVRLSDAALLVRGTPVSTPERSAFLSTGQIVLLGLMGALGARPMLTSATRSWSDYFDTVSPTETTSELRGNASSANAVLAVHTERSRWIHPPDFIGLSCVRGDLDAWTYFVPSRWVLGALSARTLSALRKPDYVVTGTKTFLDQRIPFPLLEGTGHRTRLRYSPVAVAPRGKEARRAIHELAAAVALAPHTYVRLLDGDVLIFGNMIHGRTRFGFRKNHRRFLHRAFAAYGQSDSQRVLAPEYNLMKGE